MNSKPPEKLSDVLLRALERLAKQQQEQQAQGKSP